jgi:lysophospholipase L1-like esterase
MSLTAKLVLTPLLVAQALRTRARLPRLPEAGGSRQGVVGEGPPLRLLIAGDSSAAGVGVERQHDALAGRLARELARRCGAAVHWRLVARTGLSTAQTLELLRGELDGQRPCFHVAVVATGVNDVIEQVPSQRAVAQREALANWLRNAVGVAHVVFVPLPPVHRFPGLPQPLRWIAGEDARRHDEALRLWVRTRGDVSRPDVPLPLAPDTMAADGFHPGAPVYRACAEAVARHIACRVWPAGAAHADHPDPEGDPR